MRQQKIKIKNTIKNTTKPKQEMYNLPITFDVTNGKFFHTFSRINLLSILR